MTTVYLDESGDLGFDMSKPKTSRHFLVAALLCHDTKPVDKAVRKTFGGFTKAQVKSHHGYLHAFSETPQTRRRLLRLLSALDIGVIVVKLDKRRVFTDIADEPHLLYNAIVNILMNRLISQSIVSPHGPLRLVASQRETMGLLNDNFTSYLIGHVRTPQGVNLSVDVKHASTEKGLQAVDMISWSLFRQYERSDPTYAELIRPRILEVSDVWG